MFKLKTTGGTWCIVDKEGHVCNTGNCADNIGLGDYILSPRGETWGSTEAALKSGAYVSGTDADISLHPYYVSLESDVPHSGEVELDVTMTMEEAAKEANAISAANEIGAILEERGSRYGEYKDNAEVAQSLKRILRHAMQSNGRQFTEVHLESLSMISHKLSRIVNGDPNYADSWVDIAGYAKLAAEQCDA